MSEAPPSRLAANRLQRAFWLSLAGASLILGGIGIVLPGLPTTPFVLLAAFAAARGSERLHAWLRHHARFGPLLRDWEREGAVSRRAKRAATAMMACSAVLLFLVSPRWWMAAMACAIMFLAAVWLWSRPEPRPDAESASAGPAQ
ncbi:MAG: hypothetical protein AMXMBFR59_25620 [Rhodanobacteraceae bacterium]